MCRLSCFASLRPIRLSDVFTNPNHSIVHQSYCAKERVVNSEGPPCAANVSSLNGDGFGIGWYECTMDNQTPRKYSSVKPCWSDHNMNDICGYAKSKIGMAHVRAATCNGGIVSELTCHPFKYGQFMLMHNGDVAQFHKVKRYLLSFLGEATFKWLTEQPIIDSNLLFGIFIDCLPDVQPHQYCIRDICNAIEKMLGVLQKALIQFKVEGVSTINLVISDGQNLFCVKHAFEGAEICPRTDTLYLAHGSGWGKHTFYDPVTLESKETVGMQHQPWERNIVLVSSEPLNDSLHEWIPLPTNTLTVVTANCSFLSLPLKQTAHSFESFNMKNISPNTSHREENFLSTGENAEPNVKTCESEAINIDTVYLHDSSHVWIGCRSRNARSVHYYATSNYKIYKADAAAKSSICITTAKHLGVLTSILHVPVNDRSFLIVGAADATITIYEENINGEECAYVGQLSWEPHCGRIYQIAQFENTVYILGSTQVIIKFDISVLTKLSPEFIIMHAQPWKTGSSRSRFRDSGNAVHDICNLVTIVDVDHIVPMYLIDFHPELGVIVGLQNGSFLIYPEGVDNSAANYAFQTGRAAISCLAIKDGWLTAGTASGKAKSYLIRDLLETWKNRENTLTRNTQSCYYMVSHPLGSVCLNVTSTANFTCYIFRNGDVCLRQNKCDTKIWYDSLLAAAAPLGMILTWADANVLRVIAGEYNSRRPLVGLSVSC